MHEFSLAESLMNVVIEEALKHNAKKVRKIRIRAGKLMGVVPDLLIFAFNTLSEGSIAEGAELILEEVPFKGKCKVCGYSFTLEDFWGICPNCNSDDLEIEGGTEFELIGLEIERSEETIGNKSCKKDS